MPFAPSPSHHHFYRWYKPFPNGYSSLVMFYPHDCVFLVCNRARLTQQAIYHSPFGNFRLLVQHFWSTSPENAVLSLKSFVLWFRSKMVKVPELYQHPIWISLTTSYAKLKKKNRTLAMVAGNPLQFPSFQWHVSRFNGLLSLSYVPWSKHMGCGHLFHICHPYNVGKTMPFAPSPSHHHFYRCYVYRSQSGVVPIALFYPHECEFSWIPNDQCIDDHHLLQTHGRNHEFWPWHVWCSKKPRCFWKKPMNQQVLSWPVPTKP